MNEYWRTYTNYVKNMFLEFEKVLFAPFSKQEFIIQFALVLKPIFFESFQNYYSKKKSPTGTDRRYF